MDSQFSLVLKVILLSAAISIFIKYGGSSLNLMATTSTALALVLLPTAILATILGWRAYASSRRSQTDRLI